MCFPSNSIPMSSSLQPAIKGHRVITLKMAWKTSWIVRLNSIGYLVSNSLTSTGVKNFKTDGNQCEEPISSALLRANILYFSQMKPLHRLTSRLHYSLFLSRLMVASVLRVDDLLDSDFLQALCFVFSKGSSAFIAFAPHCSGLASLPISPVILLCTRYFSRANLFPRMERIAYLRERNFTPGSCSGQISRQLLIGWGELGSASSWSKPSPGTQPCHDDGQGNWSCRQSR